MCGIYITNLPYSTREVKEKLNTIKFRGPDYCGVNKMNNITLGHLRLAIIDLDSRSNQPIEYMSQSIVFNGEIYNFQEIRKELIRLGHTFTTNGDTEVILKGYHEWGEKIVEKLNGMFAFAIYDSNRNKIFCSRDRLGVKPFYYYWKDGYFEIASQLRPIKLDKDLEIDESAVSMYLDCSYIPSPFTIYKEVKKLRPGYNLVIDLNKSELRTYEYWNLKKVEISDSTYEDAKNTLHELLKDAISIRLQADVPFGCFLSGGIDSSLIASIASKISKERIKTFSIGFENPEYDESKIAAVYSKIIGSEHTETICSPDEVLQMLPHLINVYDEPFADSSALPSLLLNKVTREHVTMALSGDGGDESFLGYNHFDFIKKASFAFKVPLIIRELGSNLIFKSIFGKRSDGMKYLLRLRYINDAIKNIFVGWRSLTLIKSDRWFDFYKNYENISTDVLQKTADLNIKLWLENDSNVKVDRASMAFSVEVRSPFLDYRIIEFARTLPVSYRYQRGRKKRILRDILKEYIPEEIFNQPKKGFSIPLGDWIKNELREEFQTSLSDDFLEIVPNLDTSKFRKVFIEHLEGKKDNSSQIWRVYVLSKWYQEFGYFKK